MTHKYLHIILTVALCTLYGVKGQKTGASLRGVPSKHALQLYWEVYSWPQDLQGFQIKKRTSKDTAWKVLSPETIVPQIEERNWTSLGLDAAEAALLQKTFEQYLEQGKLSRMPKEYLLGLFKKGGGPQTGDRLLMKSDYNMALIIGFAFVDHSYKVSDRPTYGLFYVDSQGHSEAQAAAVLSPNTKTLKSPKLDFTVFDQGIKLSWHLSDADYYAKGLYGFKVLRQSPQGSKAEEMFSKKDSTAHGQQTWSMLDPNADPNQDHTYVITPYTVAQSNLKSFKCKYKAADYQPIKVPKIDSSKIVHETQVSLSWHTDSLMPFKRRIKAFYLERRHADTLTYKRVSPILPYSQNSYLDTSRLRFSHRYSYRLVTVDKKGKTWYGTSYDLYYTGIKLPQKPDSLKATFKTIAQKHYLILSWAKDKDNSTAGYLFLSDQNTPGKLAEHLSIPLIKGNTFLYEFPSEGGRVYQFSIVPVNEKGMRGTPATLTYKIPLLDLPPFNSAAASILPNGQVALTWQYPGGIEIEGFHILADGVVIASTKDLPASAKSYPITLYLSTQAAQLVRYEVEAVGAGASQKSLPLPIYIPAFEVPEPQGLQATLEKDKGKSYVSIAWNLQDNVKEYLVFSDLHQEGAFSKLNGNTLLQEPKYRLQLLDPLRDTYTFKVAAVASNGKIGPTATYTLDLK